MTDPLKLFSAFTCERIFSFLEVQDILNCSLINKRYYEFIAKTPSCMDRIKVYLNYNKIDPANLQSLNILSQSSRNYRHFELFNLSIELYNALLHRTPVYNSIKLKRFTFYNEESFEIFLSMIHENVRELKLDRYIESNHVDGKNATEQHFEFPKLHRLDLFYVPNIIFKYFAHCKNLIELRITGKRDENFYKILEMNPQLKKLAIVSDEIDNFFDKDISKITRSKLTYFEARDIYNLTERCIDNFKKFLEKQIYSLEEIDLGDWIAADIVKMIFHMPRLKKLTFKGFHNIEEHIDLDEIEFNKAHSITTLHLIDTFSKFGILKSFITACPNVKQLKLYSLKKESLKFLTTALPKLESLTIDILEIEDLSNECDLPCLKEFKMQVYHKSLKISETTNNNFEKLIRQEMANIEQRNKVKFL